MLKNYIYSILFKIGLPTTAIRKIGNLFFFCTNILIKPMQWSGFGTYEKEIIKSYDDVPIEEKKRFLNFVLSLDNESIYCAKRHIERIRYLSNQDFYSSDILDDKEISETKILEPIAKQICKDTNFQIGNYYQLETFGYHSGLKFIQRQGIEYIIDKDCIDCGSYTGDSAYIFNKFYRFNKIHLLEPDRINFNTLVGNIAKLNLNNCLPFNVGVGKRDQTVNLVSNSGTSAMSEQRSENSILVKITSIDKFVRKMEIAQIGLIKMDIEGYEKEAIIGATDTIKNHLPILSIAIYHKGDHFYNMANLINQISNNNYNFTIRKLNPNAPVFDVFLICTPKF